MPKKGQRTPIENTSPMRPAHDGELDTLLTVKEITTRLKLSRSTWWKVANGDAVLRKGRVQLTPTRVAWRLSAVEQWVTTRAGRPVPPKMSAYCTAAAEVSAAHRRAQPSAKPVISGRRPD
jgi:predicted DNA-binding transcriptional regulator AlpA